MNRRAAALILAVLLLFKPFDVSLAQTTADREALYDAAVLQLETYLENAVDDVAALERLLNVYISGTPSETTVLFDWYYMRIGSGNEGFPEETDPSVFTGSFQDGGISAAGPGNIDITRFYSADGQQYAIGKLHWPDGYTAEMALVRP